MIEFRNVDFRYEERPILQNISFRINGSESVVFMGASGSGKSTILRLILGLETPQRGEVLIDGKEITRMKESAKRDIRKNIGMVFQDGALFDSLTVGENVGYYLFEHTNLADDEIESRVRQMLGFVGLDPDDVIDKLPEQLSGGMQRRVAIGRALLSTNPKIMLYDEPTTGLDPQSSENVLRLIVKLQEERSVCSIVVTHQIADSFAIAKRFVVIDKGTVAFDGTLDQLRDSNIPQVTEFLDPFRESMAGVLERKFVAPG
ncbi:MAG: ATP-binding cassette domain-containing protein [Candidatus Zixiibacteriota bacterium]